MSTENSNTGLKWTIGIIAFIIWVVVIRTVITDGGIPYDEGEMMLSTGKQWLMVIWTIAVVFGAVKVYGWASKNNK